jgi:hypothetical protein
MQFSCVRCDQLDNVWGLIIDSPRLRPWCCDLDAWLLELTPCRFTGPASKSHELQMDATAHAHTQRGVRGGKTRLRAALQPPSTQSSQQPGSTNGESQPRPPPLMARRVLSIRQAFGHPVMAVYFFFVMRFVWVLHDYIAAPLLGSGCDHPKRA